MELKTVKLRNIQDLIPSKLYLKFEKNGIKTIQDFLEITLLEFQKFHYVGEKVSTQFVDFKNLVESNPTKILELNKSNQPKFLPLEYSEKSSFLEIFSLIILDYLDIMQNFNYKTTKLKERQTRNRKIIQKYFGINSDKYTLDKIGIRHKINRERARQIVHTEFLEKISALMNGNYLESLDVGIKPQALDLIDSYKKDIVGNSAINEIFILKWLTDYGLNEEFETKRQYLDILLKIWGYDITANSKYHFLKNNVIYLSKSLNSELFLEISSTIYKFLEKKVIPVSIEDIIIEVFEKFDVEEELIVTCCNSISEIVRYENFKYALRFDCLSSINDYVYRLLYEKVKSLSFNELLHLINRRLVKVDKSLSLQSLKQTLRRDENIVPLGKTGNWSLVILNPNTDSQINLILKTFRILDKPLQAKEIVNFIHSEFARKDASERSIYSNLSNYKDKLVISVKPCHLFRSKGCHSFRSKPCHFPWL